MKPRDVVHWVITGHWPRWSANRWLYPNHGRCCRECGMYELRTGKQQ